MNDVINLARDNGVNVRRYTKSKIASFVIAISVLVLLFSPYPGISALTIDFSAITNISLPIPQNGPSIELSANLILLAGQTLQIDHLEVIVDGDNTHPLVYDENGIFLGADSPKVIISKGTSFPTTGTITIGNGYGYGTGITTQGYLGPDTLPYVLETLPSQYAAGTHTLQFVAVDKDTHEVHSSEIEFTINPISAPTQVTLSSLLNSSTFGQSITFTSTVTSSTTPSGTVTFYDGPVTELGTIALDSSGKAVLTTSALSVGSHDIFALYSGDAIHNPIRSVAFQLIVNPSLDLTSPIITPAITGTLGNNGWYVGDVTVSWSVIDTESAITSPACATTTIVTDTSGQTVTCTATSAGGTNSQSITIKRDTTAPTITSPSNIIVTSKTPVSPSLGSPIVSDNLDSSPTIINNAPTTFSSGTTVVTWTVSDKAGNIASTTQSVIVQTPDLVYPEAYNQFDPISKDVKVYGTDNIDGNLGSIAPSSVTKTKWHTTYDDENGHAYDNDNNDEHDGQHDQNHGHSTNTNAELRTYVITDHAGNSITLTEVVKHKGNEIKVKVTSIKYGNNQPIAPKLSTEYFEWSLDKNGSIKELEQKMTIGKDKTKQGVEAKYDSKKDGSAGQTKIKSENPKTEETLSGLVLLKMSTNDGNLIISH